MTDEFLEALLDKIVPARQGKKYLKGMIYSDPGDGKTTFLGTIPNNFIIDTEDGLTSLKKDLPILKDSLSSYSYKSFESFEAIIEKFREAPEQLKQYETISIDTISTLHKRGLEETVEREWKRNPVSNNRYVAETEHHTENNEHIRRIVDSLAQMDRNVVLTAHARTIEPKNRPAKTFPDFSEKLANTLSGMLDFVGFLYLKEVEGDVKRILRIHGNENISAKCRIPGIDAPEILNPTWEDIYIPFMKASLSE